MSDKTKASILGCLLIASLLLLWIANTLSNRVTIGG